MINDWRSFVTGKFHRFLILRFVIVGVANTLFSTIIFLFLIWRGLSLELGNGLALLCGVLVSYHTQGTIVFRQQSLGSFAKFIAVWIVIYFGNLYEIKLMIWLGANRYLAVALACVPTTMLSFFIQKMFVFRGSERREGR